MSDISFGLSWLDLVLIFGWPGLLAGAIAGAFFWKKRRILGGVIGAVVGLLVWAGVGLLIKLG